MYIIVSYVFWEVTDKNVTREIRLNNMKNLPLAALARFEGPRPMQPLPANGKITLFNKTLIPSTTNNHDGLQSRMQVLCDSCDVFPVHFGCYTSLLVAKYKVFVHMIQGWCTTTWSQQTTQAHPQSLLPNPKDFKLCCQYTTLQLYTHHALQLYIYSSVLPTDYKILSCVCQWCYNQGTISVGRGRWGKVRCPPMLVMMSSPAAGVDVTINQSGARGAWGQRQGWNKMAQAAQRRRCVH